MNAKDEIRQFVQKLLTESGDDQPLADDESLLLSGRLQSIDAVEIVTLLEEKFGIDFAEIGFDRERLDSVDAISTLAGHGQSNRA
jgi:acyl carrier protein